MKKKLHILNLEDNENDTEFIQATLEEEGIACDMTRVETEAEFVAALDKACFDLLLVDYKLPSFDGMSALAISRKKCPEIPFIFVSGSIGEDTAIEALKNGATDYVLKDKLSRLAPAVRRALKEAEESIERARADKALREAQARTESVLASTSDTYILFDRQWHYLYVNEAAVRAIGRPREQILGRTLWELYPNIIDTELDRQYHRAMDERLPVASEFYYSTTDTWWENRFYPVPEGLAAFATNITEHRNADKAQQASLRFLKTMHKHTEIKPLLEELASEIKEYTGCDSVAIRVLDEAGDIPYHAYAGFSTKFIELESPLSVKSDQCMCINVIKGTTNPLLSFYTEGGSFYMNATTRFLATVSEEEKGKTRNICNKEGYESVALVPFRSGDRILGLIHVADHRETMVPLKMVEQLESVAMQLGTAFQRANAEDALRKSEARYRHLFDNMLEGFAYCKVLYVEDTPQDFVYIHVNNAFESLTGLTNVIGKKVSEVIPGIRESNPELLRFYGRVALTGNPERFETYVESLGIWFSIAAYSTEKEYFVAVFDNITERKRTEEALSVSERQYRQLVDNALVGVYRSTPEGKFLYVNDALVRILECENAEEMLQLPVGIRYKKPEDRETFLNVLREQGKVSHYELEVPTKTGKLKTIVISAALEEGFITGMVTDVTERKHLEAQLRHAQKMEAVGTLAGGIAHDFNNILNVIIGYGALVLDKLGADSLSKGLMNEVLAAAERAAVLTKRLLAFSRKEIAEVRPININETVIGIQKMLDRTIGEDIDLQLDLKDGNLLVMADAGQIEQVLMNLVSNARDAMPKGGRLTIGTGLQEIDDEYIALNGYGKPGMYVFITIADTGHGMDAETQKKIFEPFFTTKGVGEGTGLGLAISYGIVKQHGGYIKAYSEPGQGAEFKIYLPLIEGSASLSREIEAPVSAKGGSETVLLAEDDASVRKLTRIILESFGYSVITAEDGEDAITKFMENREKIHLAMLDMIMPKKNGKEVSEALRKASPGIKILFVSGYTMDIIKSRELTESGFDVIHKPVRPQDLLRKVREVLDK